jgi:hypothetical protein
MLTTNTMFPQSFKAMSRIDTQSVPKEISTNPFRCFAWISDSSRTWTPTLSTPTRSMSSSSFMTSLPVVPQAGRALYAGFHLAYKNSGVPRILDIRYDATFPPSLSTRSTYRRNSTGPNNDKHQFVGMLHTQAEICLPPFPPSFRLLMRRQGACDGRGASYELCRLLRIDRISDGAQLSQSELIPISISAKAGGKGFPIRAM